MVVRKRRRQAEENELMAWEVFREGEEWAQPLLLWISAIQAGVAGKFQNLLEPGVPVLSPELWSERFSGRKGN